MILHKLLYQYFRPDSEEKWRAFYQLQAESSYNWLQARIRFRYGSILDLGCGNGILGHEFSGSVYNVTCADNQNHLMVPADNFILYDFDKDPPLAQRYELVLFSNTLEHLPHPFTSLSTVCNLVVPGGYLYLTFTNWLSPFGGHDTAPFHYLGEPLANKLRHQRFHTLGKNLFKLHIWQVLNWFASRPDMEIIACVPRYYPELSFITKLPILREFLTWNCAILARRKL